MHIFLHNFFFFSRKFNQFTIASDLVSHVRTRRKKKEKRVKWKLEKKNTCINYFAVDEAEEKFKMNQNDEGSIQKIKKKLSQKKRLLFKWVLH